MDNLHPRRHIFRGHACGVSAHIRRPQDQLLPVQGCSSLPVTGGLAESNVGPQSLDKWVSFDAVSTSAHGDYVDAAAGVATTTGKVAFDAAPTHTRVKASVDGLVILGRVRVAHAAVGLISRSAVGQAQPVIRLEGNILEGVRIDHASLAITLAEDFYCACDTKDKLAARHAAGLATAEMLNQATDLSSGAGEPSLRGFYPTVAYLPAGPYGIPVGTGIEEGA